MKQIPLTQGQFAIVDDDKFEWINQWKWYAKWDKNTKGFYALRESQIINGKKHHISMAREILGLKKGDRRQADHKNHVTLDNRMSNLRVVSHQQNQWNRKNPKGYIWHKTRKRYEAQIRLNGKLIYLGYFQTAEEAHEAYLSAKERYHQCA